MWIIFFYIFKKECEAIGILSTMFCRHFFLLILKQQQQSNIETNNDINNRKWQNAKIFCNNFITKFPGFNVNRYSLKKHLSFFFGGILKNLQRSEMIFPTLSLSLSRVFHLFFLFFFISSKRKALDYML